MSLNRYLPIVTFSSFVLTDTSSPVEVSIQSGACADFFCYNYPMKQALFTFAKTPLGDLIVGLAFGKSTQTLPVIQSKREKSR